MRILFISTFYPPHTVGGWPQLVEEINHHLQRRGHITRVLTSTYGVEAPVEEDGVERALFLEADLLYYRPLSLLTYPLRLRHNLRRVRQAIQTFEPDVVFIHVMWNLSEGVAWTAEQLCPGRVVYYVADYWPCEPGVHVRYWQTPANRLLFRVLKRGVAPILLRWAWHQKRRFPLAFRNVLCVSQAVRETLIRCAGIDPASAQVIYISTDTKRFRPRRSMSTEERSDLSLLYAGSLVPHKGVHTAIQAMEELHRSDLLEGIHLTVVGTGHPDYEAELRAHVARAGLDEHVHFMGGVAREQMPELLPQFDVLIFPSIWEEPLARMVQEAMACGLVVVGTPTGGTPEILRDGETGLVFPPEDPHALADRIRYLKENPQVMAKIRQNARRLVEEQFDIVRMIDEIEVYLSAVVRAADRPEERVRVSGEQVRG